MLGSAARGDNTENSNYDFMISKGRLRSLVQYVSFIDELEELLNTQVDVITDTSSDKDIIEQAQKEGILLYERQR